MRDNSVRQLRLVIMMCGLSAAATAANTANAQHDPGRDAVRLIARGKLDEGIKTVGRETTGKGRSPISDDEREFVLAIAKCHSGETEAAIAHLKRAVSQGLPVERVFAGPRALFAQLSDNADFRDWLEERRPVLLHGPMLTQVTDSSASVWVRTSVNAAVRLTAQDATGRTLATSEPVATNADTDFTAAVRVNGLIADTAYRYQVVVDGEPVGDAVEFRTGPQAGRPGQLRFGFGGGAGYTPQYNHMWQTVLNHKPQAFLMLGDNVYIDDPEHPSSQRYCYYRRQSQPLWRTFIARTCMYSIYDDHDFGTNDCVPGPEVNVPPWKQLVWGVFRQNWNNPGYGGGTTQPGCWYDFSIADVHFIMLDGRYYRDLKGGSMLGPVQKEWLKQTLRSSEGRFKIVASCVPFSPGVKPGSRDTWDGFADEREEILAFIHRNKIDGVVLMAADRHRSDLRRIPRDDGYDFYEMMSSRLTNVHTHGLVKNARGSEFIMGYNEECSFGRVTIDTTVADPTLEYAIISIDDVVEGTRVIRLSELQHR